MKQGDGVPALQEWIYLGIDQTGAIDKSGNPRPLPACVIKQNRVSLTYLPSFSKQSIFEVIQPKANEKIAICADCVFGLPDEIDLSWRQALQQIRKSQGYGQGPAQAFFRKLGSGKIFHRKIETECKANSVFKETPFQKNIQTGTYRIWKDISIDESDFYVPFLSEPPHEAKIPIYEGYPSLSWKLLFDTSSRQPNHLKEFIEEKFPKLIIQETHQRQFDRDPNLADAFVLALSLRLWMDTKIAVPFGNEGWILGHHCNQTLES